MHVQRCGKLTVSCDYIVCVCVRGGCTEARNRDLVFIAFRMMTLPPPVLSPSRPIFWRLGGRGGNSRGQGGADLTGGRGQEDRDEMREAGGGRNTLASYPARHSGWQCQPALLVHSHSHSLHWDLCLALMVLTPRASFQIYILGIFFACWTGFIAPVQVHNKKREAMGDW